jgi:misacylated tRNA(Ala) deacylase
MSTTVTVLAPSPTPKTYHRIVSDTLIIPNDGTVPVPVGLLACQRA